MTNILHRIKNKIIPQGPTPEQLIYLERKAEIEKELGMKVNGISVHELYLKLWYIKELKKAGGHFFKQKDRLLITISGITLLIDSDEEFFIIYEVFVEGIYNYYSPGKDFIFMDVGMNVGITSLFFSQNKYCTKIIGYEPFKKTYDLAYDNFALNAGSKKIEVKHFGLGYPARSLEVKYDPKNRGGVGINGMPHFIDNSTLQTETLEIKDIAAEVLISIENTTADLIVKLDCEGAEYEILDRLVEANVLNKIKVLMIEWHFKGPKPLIDILSANGYSILSIKEKNELCAMLYAYKTN